MIDPAQLTILLKAVDFVFEEGRKILEERRERRKASDKPIETTSSSSTNERGRDDAPKLEGSKEELLASPIDEVQWQNHEAEVRHLVRLLETYSNNYHLAEEQYAKWGSALVPPIIVNNKVEAENAMIETTGKLEALLAKIYRKENQPPK